MLSIILNIIGFTQSLILGPILISSSKLSGRHNLLGGLLMLVFAGLIFNSIRILVWGHNFIQFYELWSNYSLLLVGPLLYLYSRSKIKKVSFQKKDHLHFLPFIILLPALLISRYFEANFANVIEITSGLVLILSMSVYQGLAIWLIHTHKKGIEYSFILTIYGFFVVWHINLVVQSIGSFSNYFKAEYQIFATLILSILILILNFSHYSELLKKLHPVKSSFKLSSEKTKRIIAKIEREMASNKPYLESDFSLQKLSTQIGETSSYVSHVINQEYQMSFPKYIASLRVQAFVQKAKQSINHQLTIQGMAEEVGFNSPSTFNQAFKAHMHMLPSAFLKSLQQD